MEIKRNLILAAGLALAFSLAALLAWSLAQPPGAARANDDWICDWDPYHPSCTQPPTPTNTPTPTPTNTPTPRGTISIAGLGSSLHTGSTDFFTVTALNLTASASYGITVATSNSNVGFNSTCSTTSRSFTIPAQRSLARYDVSLTLYACSTSGGSVTATLSSGNTIVSTASRSVSVTVPPPHAPAPTGLRATATTRTSISLTWDRVPDAYRYKLEKRKGAAGAWTTVDAETSSTTKPARNLTCGTAYDFKVSARGDGSRYSRSYGTPPAGIFSRSTSSCQPNQPPEPEVLPPPTQPYAPPGRMLTPDVTSANGSLAVSWTAPFDHGTSPVTRYEVRHKASHQTNWSASSTSATGTTISGLTNTFAYHVSVRACSKSEGGCGDWSFSESATPSANPGALPARPAGLLANGNILSGDVSAWWQVSTNAADYNLRYAVETCTDTPQETASVCTPGQWNEVNGIAATIKQLSAGSGSSDLLTSSTVYRLQVRGTNAYGQSDWSDIAFVYPTSSPPTAKREQISILPAFRSKPPLIATNPLYGYQPANTQGVHEFRYIICDGTIPSGVNINATQIAGAIEKWEEAVKKDSSGASMVRTTRTYHPSPAPSDACQPPSSAVPWSPIAALPTGRNEVMFVDQDAMRMAPCGAAPACWRSNTWDTVLLNAALGSVTTLPSIAKGTILLNSSKGAVYWNSLAHNNACKRVEYMVVHEAGHALGIGWPANDHPRNPTLSIMSAGYTHSTLYCEPQVYDIAAVMANYQSK